jgi:hypothetical protein
LPQPIRPAFSITSQLSNVTGRRMPKNCVGSGS